jgi:hypothetical protein
MQKGKKSIIRNVYGKYVRLRKNRLGMERRRKSGKLCLGMMG